MDYITNEDTIIFGPSFNKELNPTLLTNYKKVIFADYELNNDLFDIYEKFHTYIYYGTYKKVCFDGFYKLKYFRNEFNFPVSNIQLR